MSPTGELCAHARSSAFTTSASYSAVVAFAALGTADVPPRANVVEDFGVHSARVENVTRRIAVTTDDTDAADADAADADADALTSTPPRAPTHADVDAHARHRRPIVDAIARRIARDSRAPHRTATRPGRLPRTPTRVDPHRVVCARFTRRLVSNAARVDV